MNSLQRVLIKVSGESLKGEDGSPFSRQAILRLLAHVKCARQAGCYVALVVGGGNLWRGKESTLPFLSRPEADGLGMMATVMNAVALKAALLEEKIPSIIFSAVTVGSLCEPYAYERARTCLAEGTVVLFAGGTGNPFFTTDTAAVLRALEMKCDLLLKLTKVDGVYDRDPIKYPQAHRLERVTFQEVLTHRYQVMDATAVALAREGGLRVGVGSFFEEGLVSQVLKGQGRVTYMEEGNSHA